MDVDLKLKICLRINTSTHICLLVLILFCSINLYSQTDTGLTYKSFAYVSADKGGNIQIIDNITKTFNGSIGIISANTNWRNSTKTLGISRDGQLLFQDSYGLTTTTQIISIATNNVVSGVNFSNGGGMIASPDGNVLYAAPAYTINKYNILDQTVTAFRNRNTGTCNSANPNEAYASLRLAISSNGNYLYVANLDPRKKGISVYDTSDGSEVKINSGISGAQRLNISPDDAFVYVCNTSWGYGACTNDPSLMNDIYGNNTNHSSDIAILNTVTNTIVDYINLGSISDVVVSKDGSKIYVGTTTGVKVIARDLDANLHTVSSDTYATGAVTHMGIDPSGNFLYVVSANVLKLVTLSDGTISTISTTSESNKSLGNIVFSSYYTPPIGTSVSTDSSNNNSILSWTAVESPNLVNYKIYGGTSISNLQLIGTVNSGIETFTHSGLSGGVTYYYRISAVDNLNNESNKSSTVSTTTAILPAVITGPNNAKGNTSAISIPENQQPVFQFSADVAVVWSLGNTNDEALFTIDSSGNLVFNTKPDYELPADKNLDNIYIVDIIATDILNNITTQTLSLSLADVLPAVLSSLNPMVKTSFDDVFALTPITSTGSAPISYTSSNLSVATISGIIINIVGGGVTTITATQESDATYDSVSISTTLTVNSVSVVTKNGQITGTNPTFLNKNGAIGGNFGVNNNGMNLQTKTFDIITSGLVMYLDASNAASYSGTGTIWNDLSGFGNNGTLKNGVVFNSANNGSMVFDGTNDYFVTDSNLDLSDTDKLTIQIILKTATSSPERMIMEHSVNWNSNNSYGILTTTSGKMQFTDHNQGYNVSNTTTTITDNNWHILSATSDRSLGASNQNEIYIDGNLSSITNTAGLLTNNSGNYANLKLYLASRAGTNYFFNGNIAQILIYKRVLTALEIQQNFNALKNNYGL